MHRYLKQRIGCLGLFLGLGAALALNLVAAEKPADDQPHVDPLTQKSYTQTIPDTDLTIEMVPVPGGTFMMGSPAGEKGRGDDEGPQHLVKIAPFWMGKTEMTWEQYDVFWNFKRDAKPKEPKDDKSADAVTRPTPPYGDPTFGLGHDGQPALCMTHHAAMEYCRWLSARTGKTYRLPTEAEWEWACRAGTKTAYSWGDDPSQIDDYAWYKKNSDTNPHPVAQKKPNPWGLYDMYGNVAEWCLDSYQANAYKGFAANKLSIGPVTLPTADRFSDVARGGSYYDTPDKLRSAARRGSNKDWIKRDPNTPQSIWWLTDADFVGFRIICPVQEQENLKGIKSKVTRESD